MLLPSETIKRDTQGEFDVTVICGHNTIPMLLGNTAYCAKLSGEDLSRYSNKIESVDYFEKMQCDISRTLHHNMAGKQLLAQSCYEEITSLLRYVHEKKAQV